MRDHIIAGAKGRIEARPSDEEAKSAAPAEPLRLTQPLLPPLEQLLPHLEDIWERSWVTNQGPVTQRFERAVGSFLGVDHVTLVASGTLGLVTALRGLGLRGDVITTPFTFVATAHAAILAGLRPVFVDVDPDTYNLDPEKVEAAIDERTCAVLPVHCFGRACDSQAIEAVARAHDLEVVYDAAHAFGVQQSGRSLLSRGRASVVSFHATKVFNTVEGGAIVSPTAEAKARLDRLANHGIVDEEEVTAVGMNAKMNEIAAAVGLAALPHAANALSRRHRIAWHYRSRLADLSGIRVPSPPSDQTENHAYFPIEILDGHPLGRDGVYRRLRAAGIEARRYFHPLLTDLDSIRNAVDESKMAATPNAAALAKRILCLPIHPHMSIDDADRVVEALRI